MAISVPYCMNCSQEEEEVVSQPSISQQVIGWVFSTPVLCPSLWYRRLCFILLLEEHMTDKAWVEFLSHTRSPEPDPQFCLLMPFLPHNHVGHSNVCVLNPMASWIWRNILLVTCLKLLVWCAFCHYRCGGPAKSSLGYRDGENCGGLCRHSPALPGKLL